MTRKYELKQRALSQAETRQRIVDATVDLHRELGPLRTTISAIAERAGVQRLTVYRHFPDDRALFGACSSQWRAAHPMPDPSAWAAVEDPAERLEAALVEIYAWFAADRADDGERAARHPGVTADAGDHRASAPVLAGGAPRAGIRLGGAGERAERLRAVIGHAVEFGTWRSLARAHGLDDSAAAELMVRLARGV